MTEGGAARHGARNQRGQGIVEAALALPLLLVLLVGAVDMGRAVYQYNGVAEAARELARETSVHPGAGSLGTSPETLAALAAHEAIVPALTVDSFACVDIAGVAVTGTCQPGQWVRVTVASRFDPALPLLLPFAPFLFTASGSAQIQ